MPRYPNHSSQPFTGRLPTMVEMGPQDLLPTSSTSSYYQDKIDAAHGRRLAGLGSMEPAYALNELQAMASEDDVQGAGIFDPPGTQKNIHGSAGVFADNVNLPGYHARELPYSLSEERDITTGRQIRAVPNGAVANDSAAQIAFLEAGLYPTPNPAFRLIDGLVPGVPTYDVMQNPEPVQGLGYVRSKTRKPLFSNSLFGRINQVRGLGYTGKRRYSGIRGLGEVAADNKLWLIGLVAGAVVVYAAINQKKGKGKRR